jgi:hypothetical protein
VIAAFFANLGYFQHHITGTKPGSRRQATQINTLDNQIFSKSAVCQFRALLLESSYFFQREQTYLAMPVSGMGIPLDAMTGDKFTLLNTGLWGSPHGAYTNSADYCHGIFLCLLYL